MTFVKYTRVFAAAAMMLAAIPATAGEDFAPVQTLVPETRQALSIAPTNIALQGNLAYVLGSNAAGADVIELRDAQSLATITSAAMEMQVDDIVVDPRGNALYVIGNDGQSTRLEVLDTRLNRIGRMRMKAQLGYPTLSVTADGVLIVSGLRTTFSEGFLGALDIRNPAAPQIRRDIYVGEAYGGVAGGWFDSNSGALFLNAAWDSRLFAIATGKSYVMSEFGVDTASGDLGDPYVIASQMGNHNCRDGAPSSFLIADMNRGLLTLVDYNEPFQSLDTQSLVEFNLTSTGALGPRLPGTNMRQPEGLISASCDQSVIFLGSRTSYEVAQFARNQSLSSLERVGTIRLPGRPVDIAVSDTGNFALAVSSENRSIMRFAATSTEDGTTRIIGNADIRQLQRTLTEAGLPVGSIDGIMGAKTLRALDIAERKFGISLNTDGNLKQTVETLKKALK